MSSLAQTTSVYALWLPRLLPVTVRSGPPWLTDPRRHAPGWTALKALAQSSIKGHQLPYDETTPIARPRDASVQKTRAESGRTAELFTRPVLLVPGLGGSGPTHWQSDWQARHCNMERVHQADWDAPDLNMWVTQLADDVAQRPGVMLVAHSLACSLVAHLVERVPTAPVSGALLVSPADVESPAHTPDEVRGFAPIPLRRMPFPTLVAASDNDPFVSPTRAQKFAESWGARLVMVGPCGHVNPESGFGPWPLGLKLLGELQQQIDQQGGSSETTRQGQR